MPRGKEGHEKNRRKSGFAAAAADDKRFRARAASRVVNSGLASTMGFACLVRLPGPPVSSLSWCPVKILLSEAEIRAGVHRLAHQIQETHGNQPLTIIGIMTGSIILLADLIRVLDMPLRVGVIQTSSYRNGTGRGDVVINSSMMPDILARDVLLIDDIFDTGHTLSNVVERMGDLGPRSIRSAVLLLKKGRQEVDMVPDFVGFEIPDEFVIGYGLDYCDEYRHLPFIGALESSELPEYLSS
jgi:hypoxanthine phosphoribosyltransferase